MDRAIDIGKQAEEQALRFLKTKGLTLHKANYSCKQGELDLIMADGETIVFVEVRKRKHIQYGEGSETVGASKQTKLYRAATHYLIEKELYDKVFCRFDIISINQAGLITWIKNAFEKNYDTS
jgi:putative endonuclease